MSQITIAIDAMGGDFGPSITVPASLAALDKDKNLNLILVGDQEQLTEALKQHSKGDNKRLKIKHASQVVGMDESPSKALRGKKDSSMRIAINQVKEAEADAVVSAGNTGALMATARFVLKTLPGIDRPAIISALPAVNGHTHMLDLGANVDSSAEALYQFALMGSVLASAVDNKKSPTIGLLNVGEEEIKGNEQVKQAHQLLQTHKLSAGKDFNYVGYVEGDDIYKGSVDVVVCDGFVGNVSLKTSEGLAKMISQAMKEEFKRNIFTKLAALIAMPILKSIRRRFDPREYNGASFVGLRGIVVKSHGGADAYSFSNAIAEAVIEVKMNVPEQIKTQLTELMDKRQAS